MSSIPHSLLQRGTFLIVLLALSVSLLGAYTRLQEAGLGCPDWPTCYGQLTPPQTAEAIHKATRAFPGTIVDRKKAAIEMTHRYFAETLGFVLLLWAGVAYKTRKQHPLPVWLPLSLVLLVLWQGLLGKWTVTYQLLPLIVMGHLLGGCLILSGLWISWLYLLKTPSLSLCSGRGSVLSALLLGVLVLQISLGGWTSANNAALVCPDFPTCQGEWWPSMRFTQAFQGLWPFATSFPSPFLEISDKTAIHYLHRIGALCTVSVGLLTIVSLWRARAHRWALGLTSLFALQVSLGIVNVVSHMPLWGALLHHGVAIILLLTCVSLHFLLPKKQRYA